MLDPSSKSLVEALEDDPFYIAITSGPEIGDRRRSKLAEYFSYSLQEANELGRAVYLEDRTLGASAWLLPAEADREKAASARKQEFLEQCLGRHGLETYQSIVKWMSRQSAPLVKGAWYLSIIGIAPHAQGRGLGQRLLDPTLAEADTAGADCFLETFSSRNVKFYERLGFRTTQVFHEPTTDSDYALMTRPSRGRHR